MEWDDKHLCQSKQQESNDTVTIDDTAVNRAQMVLNSQYQVYNTIFSSILFRYAFISFTYTQSYGFMFILSFYPFLE